MKEEITVRVAELKDAQKLLEIYEPYVNKTAITFEYDVPSLEEFTDRMRNTLEKYPYYVALMGDEVVGYAYAGDFHTRAAYQWCAETSIYVKEDIRGKGIGKVLYDKLERALKEMGILNLNACIGYTEIEDEYLTNASERFHERMGYTKVARSHKCGYKYGRWYDIIWMEKMIGDHVENPAPVKTFLEIRKFL